ncbi:glycosyl transferase family 90 [Kitasatospora sp. MAP5-34]|uniref:glycosyl transferase family 90 n=1 Tax=Kitasatospora sp. MAP5-34 TaxID=3035102 RepID=UPI002474118F|nr:glycosyl transferase family 90 [Kitasatospora sp. MAP5-34]MDH6574659.1 hypothetical protein [Kitasatospora sp. MAP5-34]
MTDTEDRARSNYLLELTDDDLLRLIDERVATDGFFGRADFPTDLLTIHPALSRLREVQLIPPLPELIERQITQLVRLNGDGTFSFLVMRLDDAAALPFLLPEEARTAQTLRLIAVRMLPLGAVLGRFVAEHPEVTGSLPFSHADAGRGDGVVLSYCSARPAHALLPDSDFLHRRAYQDFQDELAAADVPWEERQPVAYWRGSATGPKDSDQDWRSMRRFRLCRLGLELADTGLLDFGVTRVTDRFRDPQVIAEIRGSRLTAPYARAIDQVRFKYLIDINGHTVTWSGLFVRLLTGSVVLRVDCPEDGTRQWYHDRLVPWENYVPVRADLSDLVEVVGRLRDNDELARDIGRRGRELALSLTYEGEIERALPVLHRCLLANAKVDGQLRSAVDPAAFGMGRK